MSGKADLLTRLGHLAQQWWEDANRSTETTGRKLVGEYLRTLDELYVSGWDNVLGWQHELPDSYLPARYLEKRRQVIDVLESMLATLAMRYRRSPDGSEEETEILADYRSAMEELFRIGHWSGELDAESMLPNDLMPPVYKEYWERRLSGTLSRAQKEMMG
jgi:hypothetical protein